ncbi:FtsX-like permease family protein [Alicycliphilus denitrificans]|uniref:ABC transporter permease n=1 Tax=Alicycliphilus denitrificans TaxID=179636 RepID=UPI003850D9BF
MLIALLRTFSWRALRHHPWRSAAAATAVMLGVALGFAVHAINASALDEFSQAVRAVGGQPDLELRATRGTLPESLYGLVAAQPQVQLASPWLELPVRARSDAAQADVPLRVLGADALLLPAMAPALAPRAFDGSDRLAMLAPATVFLNPAAQQALGLASIDAPTAPLTLQAGLATHSVRVAGTVAAGGPPLALMDIGAAQDLFGRAGQLTRIELRLRAGTTRAQLQQALTALPGWPPGVQFAAPQDAVQRVDSLSRAYRVNLTVLALVALFTGAFLVYSVLALSVAQRAPQLALLAVLGATPRARLALVLLESAALGLVGSVAGIALGTLLAALALALLGGDLGGGYFTGAQPALQWSATAAMTYGLLGVAAALIGGWWPARQAQRLAPAQALKGLGAQSGRGGRPWIGIFLIASSALLASVPPIFDLPLAAYVAVGLLLIGGMALLPSLVRALLQALQPLATGNALALLALERARRMPGSAAVAVGGVVAALSLAVALTVMVGSFRGSVGQWLDSVLPAPLYLRAAAGASGDEAAVFPPGFAATLARLPGVARVQALRTSSLQLQPDRPPVGLLARPLGPDVAQALPLVGPALPVPAGRVGVYVSEAVRDLYGARPGADWPLLSDAFRPSSQYGQAQEAIFYVAGVWRDYVRQHGAVALDGQDFARLTGDARASDLALWPAPGASAEELQAQVLQQARESLGGEAAAALAFTTAETIRARSMALFDRSFAITYWLQAVAIAIGLFGIAASFSAQVLARRKEFGLLAHLGLTRRQILAVVAAEGTAWTAVGALAGLLLGLAVAVVLVHVVNPQSFHWSMDLALPWPRLAALAATVIAVGTLTAWLAGAKAAGQDAVLAVKEDW